MGQRLLQDLATANEQRLRSQKEAERLRKQVKRKRFDGFTFVQRRTALILYIMGFRQATCRILPLESYADPTARRHSG